MKATVNAILFRAKVLRNGEHPVMMRVTRSRQSKYVSLGISCKEELWDQAKGLPKTRHPLYKELTSVILKTQLGIQKELLTLDDEEQEFSLKGLKTLSTDLPVQVQVLTYFDQVETQLFQSGRIGYAKMFRFTANSLRNFQGGKDFAFTEINTSFLLRYEAWFLGRGVMYSFIFVFMRTFKTLINYARKEGYVKPDFTPFREFSFSKYRRIKTRKRSLTKSQIRAIADFYAEPGSIVFHARNYFMFSYYCRGINFIDMAHLQWENIQGGRLLYTRKKTKELFSISLLEPAQALLDYYRSEPVPGQQEYIFPILQVSLPPFVSQFELEPMQPAGIRPVS